MILSNCHTHTTYCDGKNTAEEMIRAAIEKDFKSIGISSHSPMTGGCDWPMQLNKVDAYINEINALKDKYKDEIQVYCGIELDDYFEGIDLDKFDYSIGSVHQFREENSILDVDYTSEMLQEITDKFFSGDWNRMAEAYFEKLADFVINTDVDVVGHFDLITKFNEDDCQFSTTNDDYINSAKKAIDRILEAKNDIIFEVNTGAMSRCGKKYPYPARFILEYLNDKKARITITGDSHSTDTLDFGYNTAIKLCKECGYETAWILCDGGFSEVDL